MCIPSIVTISRSIFHASKQGLCDVPAASLAFLLHQNAGWVGEIHVSPDFWCFANEVFVNVYMGCSMATESDWSSDALRVVSLDKLYVRAKFCCGDDPARNRHDFGVAFGTGPSRVLRAIIEGPNLVPRAANWLNNAMLAACDGRSVEKMVRCNLGVPVMSGESVLYKVPGALCSFLPYIHARRSFSFSASRRPAAWRSSRKTIRPLSVASPRVSALRGNSGYDGKAAGRRPGEWPWRGFG